MIDPRILPVLCIAATGALAGSCGGDDALAGDVAGGDAAADTATSFDAVPFDSLVFDTLGEDSSVPDTTATDTAGPADATDAGADTGVGCDTFGCACAGNADCLDGLCIEGADGSICTTTCISSCPDGYDCLQASIGGADPVSACVPRHVRLCRPCRADADCQSPSDPYPAYCVAAANPADGSFCGSSCAVRPCPEGYSCEDVATAGGGTARQCVVDSGQCACRASWAALGFSTDCKVQNAFGACDGTRACGAAGLTVCSGPQAGPELCDGQDNDCNGATDDIPAVDCLVTNGFGSCHGTTGCIGSQAGCIGKEPAPEVCDGIDNNCVGGTDEGSCDDGLACTADNCQNGSDCQHALNAGACLINGACWSTSAFNPLNACEQCDPIRSTVTWSQTPNTCVIGGQCYPNGAVNPLNACQICNPNQSASSWTTAGNTCTIGGQCYLANDVDPQNTCQICVPAKSTTAWTQASNTCNILGQCYAEGAKKPGASCFVCDPARNATGWSAAALNTACNDGSACSSDDHCDGAGACVGNTTCNDGIACTADTCTANGCDNSQVAGGYCRIAGTCWTTGAVNPQNGCQICSAAAPTAWSGQPTSVGCSDGQFCTVNDHCNGSGACVGGSARDCGDAYACTTDSCNENGDACASSLQQGKCIISSSCYSDNDVQAGNVCNECEPTASTSAWTFKTNKVCDDGNACTDNDKCAGAGCAGTLHTDGYEPNESIAGTRSLGITMGDGTGLADLKTLNANLYGSGDVDVFSYRITDDTNVYDPRPHVELSSIPTGANYDLCVYWKCDDPGSQEAVTCENGTASTLESRPGCCSKSAGTTGETVQFTTQCDNSTVFADDETGTVYVRVYLASGSYTCSDYTVKYGNK